LRLPGAAVIDVGFAVEGVIVTIRLRRRRRAAWLAQQMAKTPIAGMLRIAWDSVGRIVQGVVLDHLDQRRLDGLVAIGVDEISYRRGQRYLTSVVDHKAAAIVWCAPGRNAQTLQAFFDELGPERA